MSDKCAVPHFKFVLTYFKQTQRFFLVTYLIMSNIGKNPKSMKNQFKPGLNSPETDKSSCQETLHIMTEDTALCPFDPSLKTMMIADAGQVGITTSVFQAEEPDTWIPMDLPAVAYHHVSNYKDKSRKNPFPLPQSTRLSVQSEVHAWESNPWDYFSWHPITISAYTASEFPAMVIKQADEMDINKIITYQMQ